MMYGLVFLVVLCSSAFCNTPQCAVSGVVVPEKVTSDIRAVYDHHMLKQVFVDVSAYAKTHNIRTPHFDKFCESMFESGRSALSPAEIYVGLQEFSGIVEKMVPGVTTRDGGYHVVFAQELERLLNDSLARSERPAQPNTPPAMPQMVTAAVQATFYRIQTEGICTKLITVTGDGSNVIKGSLSVSGPVTLGTEPTANSDATTKLYVDNAVQAGHLKGSCVVKSLPSEGNITLSGLQLINTVMLVEGNRILLNNQTDGKENGIWVAHSTLWTRPDDFADGSHATGAQIYVQVGDSGHPEWWICINAFGSDIVGVDALQFAMFGGPGAYSMANAGDAQGAIYQGTSHSGFQFNVRGVHPGPSARSNIEVSTPPVPDDTYVYVQTASDLYIDNLTFPRIGSAKCVIDGATGNITTMGRIAAAQASIPSDARIKTAVQMLDSDDSLDIVNRLRPVSYKFTEEWRSKNKLSDTTHAGLIAQEVQEVLPSAVAQVQFPSGDKIYTVSYEQLIPHLLRSVQALHKEVRALRKSALAAN